jgi:Flp pilus assembly protein TadB
MERSYPRHVRTLVLIAAGLAAVIFAPGLVLLTLTVAVALVVGTVLLAALGVWAVRRRIRRVLREDWSTFPTGRVVDGVIVEAR